MGRERTVRFYAGIDENMLVVNQIARPAKRLVWGGGI